MLDCYSGVSRISTLVIIDFLYLNTLLCIFIRLQSIKVVREAGEIKHINFFP